MARPRIPDQERRRHRLEVRLTDTELADIDYVCSQLRCTRTEAIVQSVWRIAQDLWELEQEKNSN